MRLRVYGIKNCDTCRRARRWLREAGVAHDFIDVREDGLAPGRLEAWQDTLGAAALLNKRSKTWRDFDTAQREAAERDPIAACLAHPTLIRRPILETTDSIIAGFSDRDYQAVIVEDGG